MAKYKKIVLTGGPCAGKTTAEEMVKEELSKQGYRVFFISETATDLLKTGISPETVGLFEFQKAIFNLQMKKEQVVQDAIKDIPDDQKVIVVCDRGVIDGKAFCANDEMYQKILYDLNLNETYMRDQYDAVFHLTTVAYGAEEYYGNTTNPDRREDLEAARQADDKLVHAWTGHPHFTIIDNENRDATQKMKALIAEINEFLDENKNTRQKRQFLLTAPNWEELERKPNCHKVNMVQTYLTQKKENVQRMVQQVLDSKFPMYYLITTQTLLDGTERVKERRLSAEEYANLIAEQDYKKRPIVKNRYRIMEHSQYFELDAYPNWKDFAVLEVNISNTTGELVLPDYLQSLVQKEVTGTDIFQDDYLATQLTNSIEIESSSVSER